MWNVKCLILLASFSAFSQEIWLCSSQASQMQGNSVLACGVGEGASESIARRKALLSARSEFNDLCDASSDCSAHKHMVTPGRTSCEHSNGQWKCYRLVTYSRSIASNQAPIYKRNRRAELIDAYLASKSQIGME